MILLSRKNSLILIRKISNLITNDLREFIFLLYGQKYWIFDGWTKGFLFTHEGGDEPVICHKYDIKKLTHKGI
jgi:hypothetical protein